MNDELKNLELKRQRLIAQAASQRTLLAQDAQAWRKPLAMTDKGLSVFRYIKQHPVLIAGATVLSITKPTGVGKWLRRSLFVWQVAKKVIFK